MTKALDRLSKMLDERDEKIEELEAEIAQLKHDAETDRWWFEHREFKTDPSPALPVPRLEIRWVERNAGDGYGIEAQYSIVYRHFLDQVVFVPLGLTRSSGSFARRLEEFERWGHLDTPFRDGAHLIHDMKQLRMPGFVILGDTVEEIAICTRCGRRDAVHLRQDPFPDCAGFIKGPGTAAEQEVERTRSIVEAALAVRDASVEWMRVCGKSDEIRNVVLLKVNEADQRLREAVDVYRAAADAKGRG